MSIIGRLDDQVDAVLIRPLDRKRAPQGEDTAPGRVKEDATKTTPAVETESPPAKKSGDEGALPVWLL